MVMFPTEIYDTDNYIYYKKTRSNTISISRGNTLQSIESLSKKYNINPNIVKRLIEVESNFNPNRVSDAGAIGLCQIMPDTGRWCAESLGLDFSEEKLFEPEYNVEIDCFYLRHLLDIYGEDYHAALSHYNMGWVRRNTKTIYSKTIIGG